MRSVLTGRQRLLSGAIALMLMSPVLADTTYTVVPGDSLSKIAQRFSISQNEIMTRNHITDPNKVSVGQVLKLPDSVQSSYVAPASGSSILPANLPLSRARNPRELAEARARLLAQERGNQVVANAQNYLGTPYRWAGTTSRGIDCSGLVVRSMALLGKNVPHNAAALYKMGVKVSYEELQPGDLVFFHTTRKGISHVGIWAGDNKFIHASSSRGVVTDRMEGYYAKRLVGARRIH